LLNALFLGGGGKRGKTKNLTGLQVVSWLVLRIAVVLYRLVLSNIKSSEQQDAAVADLIYSNLI
jgi:hypothetical protein